MGSREGERTTGAVSGRLRTQKPMTAAHQRARKKRRAAARAVEGEEIQDGMQEAAGARMQEVAGQDAAGSRMQEAAAAWMQEAAGARMQEAAGGACWSCQQ
ncbi:hypothetical protein PF004_g14792 [Phytophthora fragariae]|uniref:Uncharacterized protein n=1 Tax=Phytophthora fragariae TaxID=53985 RepID=A0A6G0NN72_9STRA|nr:hypothetical protein PF004_g14792 [Phytophthora fragariae]